MAVGGSVLGILGFNRSVGMRLGWAFGVVLALLCGVAAVANQGFTFVAGNTLLAAQGSRMSARVSEAATHFGDARADIRDYLLTSDAKSYADAASDVSR
jgi:hypothetical protein